MKTITKLTFLKTCDKFKPNKFITFISRYFSNNIKEEDKWLQKIVIGTLLSLFLSGLIGVIIEQKHFTNIVTTIFYIILSIFVLSYFVAILMNNYRIRKIRKILGISKEKYNELSIKYLDESI